MLWVLLAAAAFAVVLRAARRRRTLLTVLRSESISTLPIASTKKQTARTKAALDAATAALR